MITRSPQLIMRSPYLIMWSPYLILSCHERVDHDIIICWQLHSHEHTYPLLPKRYSCIDVQCIYIYTSISLNMHMYNIDNIVIGLLFGQVNEEPWSPDGGGPGRGSEFNGPQKGVRGEGACHCTHHRTREKERLRTSLFDVKNAIFSSHFNSPEIFLSHGSLNIQ